jgi:hypothetical protein
MHSKLSLAKLSCSDIVFNRPGFQLLTDEISREREDVAVQIILLGEFDDDSEYPENRVIGMATVNLWFMIEDSAPIVLQVCNAKFYINSS